MLSFLTICTIISLLLVIAWQATDRKDMRDEIRRYRDAEDARRYAGTCCECGIDVDDECAICGTCQRGILQSGDH